MIQSKFKYYWNVMIGKHQDYNVPKVTCWLVLITTIIWLFELAFPEFFLQIGAMNSYIAPVQPWRFVTSMFLHSNTGTGGVMHILMNMYSLYIVGETIERFIGPKKFFIIYILCGIGSSVFSTLYDFVFVPSDPEFSISVGASGAIMGLFAILIFLYKRLNAPTNQLFVVLIINLGLPIFIPGIDWKAHIFGFITGIILSFGLGLIRSKYATVSSSKLFNVVTIGLVTVFVLIEIILVIIFGEGSLYILDNLSS
jgi:membrane associated rhomboid family serine protease